MYLFIKAEVLTVDVGKVSGPYHIVVECCVENCFDIFIACVDFDNGKVILPCLNSFFVYTVKIETFCFGLEVEHCILRADKADTDFKLDALILKVTEIDINRAVNIESYNAKRQECLKDGTIAETDGKYYLTKIVSFRTPSGASDFVLGGSTNGWVEWKNKDGKTLDSLFRQQ